MRPRISQRTSAGFRSPLGRGVVALAACWSVTACSSPDKNPAGGSIQNGGTGGGAASGGMGGTTFIGTAGSATGGSAGGPIIGGCKGLRCQVKSCPGAATTSISGKVFDPSGTLPLYNAIVYVPAEPLTPLPQGAGCTCDVNGDPIVATLTDTAGNFELFEVPSGADIPLVVQIGKWRRQFTLPQVPDCVDTAVPEGTLRLPGRQVDGEMPKIALTTGAADALECLIRKLGIDPPASSLWNSVATLQPYDVTLLSCEGEEYLEEKVSGLKPMADYANLGGRVFLSHWHQVWLKQNSNFPVQIAQYTSQMDIGTLAASVVTTFPKGQALSEWLVNVQASTTPGQIELANAQYTIVTENPLYAQSWISTATPQSVQYLSANTPFGAAPTMQCGRMVLSDLHVAGGATTGGGTDTSSPAQPFPMGCVTTGLSAQEKVLAFMLFDITSCLIPDNQRPVPPVVR
jgi:hypothetical protein